ncbi:hypothetical protein [Alkalihalobacillus pseudalcaliphilus]|uniref:hypothetical protein n=1 Tax=Alkalihalobacillus pseudalcaliphilus TaxID=79884 RepID=UPI000A73AE61|nr:hypothetical protein [Alkalihalobacillus pseudalcaliphilus]
MKNFQIGLNFVLVLLCLLVVDWGFGKWIDYALIIVAGLLLLTTIFSLALRSKQKNTK